jgi:DNA-binding response OmpR family regulator
MDGLELHLELAGSEISTPTILTTAYPEECVRTQALKAGVKFYLAKPLEADELLSCIRAALGRSEGPEGEGSQG